MKTRSLQVGAALTLVVYQLLNGLLPLLELSRPMLLAVDVAFFSLIPSGLLIAACLAAADERAIAWNDVLRRAPEVAVYGVVVFFVFTFLFLLGNQLGASLADSDFLLPIQSWLLFAGSSSPATFYERSLLASLYAAISAGILEELIYRKVGWNLIVGRDPRTLLIALYVLTSALAFATVHWELGFQGLARSFLIGIFAAWFYARTRTVGPLIVAHIGLDLVAFLRM